MEPLIFITYSDDKFLVKIPTFQKHDLQVSTSLYSIQTLSVSIDKDTHLRNSKEYTQIHMHTPYLYITRFVYPFNNTTT